MGASLGSEWFEHPEPGSYFSRFLEPFMVSYHFRASVLIAIMAAVVAVIICAISLNASPPLLCCIFIIAR